MKGRLQLSYILTLCLTFTLAIAVPVMTSAEMCEEWVARYNGPADDGADSATAIAMDSLGNTYVTGWSEDDYATVKYDSDGNELWVARYNGPGNGGDSAEAIAIDASGNVYVTGWSEGIGTGEDYATVKYDTNGIQLWVARYNGPGNDYDVACAIAVDASGNVYVTGRSEGSGTEDDYATVKYDTDGNQLWVARYNGPGNSVDDANAIAVDESGNVYVTGVSWSGTDSDYATVKYNTNGNQLWVKRYGPENSRDEARAIAVDSAGNIYVTGEIGFGEAWTGSNYATVKYDTDGNQLWVTPYNMWVSGLVSRDGAHAIAVDTSGNVYVTGSSTLRPGYPVPGTVPGETTDYATVKYDTAGNELWVARHGPGRYWARAIALDGSGSVYVTGAEGHEGHYTTTTVKYDTNGNEIWVKRYSSENSRDEARAIAVDSAGNIYVAGGTDSGTYTDYATVKYDTNGNELWVARYDGLPGNDSDVANAIAVDTSGNVYVTGQSEGSGTGEDYATVKYDTDGNEIWVARYNGLGNDSDGACAIAVDASGNVYVTGQSPGSGTGDDYATVKYDTDGNQLWVARYNGPGNDSDGAYALAIDESGNVYVTGRSEGSGTGRDYATVKYDTDGNELWVARYNGPGNDSDGAYALAIDESGNVYVTGRSEGSRTGRDYATVKYDTDGNQLWVQRYNGPGNGDDLAKSVVLDLSGNVCVTGYSYGVGTDDDYATIKYDTDGNQLWVARYDGPRNDPDWKKYDTDGNQLRADWAWAIVVDASGNIYVTGMSEVSGTDCDYATIKYDTNGNQLWVKGYDGYVHGDKARAIAIDASGNVYVTGESHSGIGLDYATVKYVEGLPEGWSMISLPVRPEIPTVAKVFPLGGIVYKYQKGTGYVRVQAWEELEVGMGYWVFLYMPQPYVIQGTEITKYTIPVADGWYMIGGCSMPAQKMVTSGKIDVIYGYTQGKGYTRVPGSQPLERGKGYWILFSNTSEEAEFTASTSVSE